MLSRVHTGCCFVYLWTGKLEDVVTVSCGDVTGLQDAIKSVLNNV